MSTRHRSDLTVRQRKLVASGGVVQLVLLAAALLDLRRRPAEQVNGSKRLWSAAVFVNFLGPLAYFRYGRRRPPFQEVTPAAASRERQVAGGSRMSGDTSVVGTGDG